MTYIATNNNNPKGPKEWGFDNKSVEISKALFDLSKHYLGLWNYLVLFDFKKLEKDQSIKLYSRYSRIQTQGKHSKLVQNLSINDAMYKKHDYRQHSKGVSYSQYTDEVYMA